MDTESTHLPTSKYQKVQAGGRWGVENLLIFDENGENLLIFSLKKKVITFPRVLMRGKFGNLEGKWGKFW